MREMPDPAQITPPELTAKGGDFHDMRACGDSAGSSYAIGHPVAVARDKVAAVLVRWGVTPNRITVLGFVLTSVAGACLALGASHTFGTVGGCRSSWWLFGAFWLLVGAGACDMLDGAMARVGHKATRFGQVLDSTLDRFSDAVLYLGIIIHFAVLGNVTLCALAAVALIHTFAISYIKARSDNLIDSGAVGWWQRPERCVGFLTGTLFGHIPALLWQQATLPFFSVLRRLRHTAGVLRAQEQGRDAPVSGPLPGMMRYVAIWRHPRGSVYYDVMALVNIGWIIVAPWVWPFFYGRTDPLRAWLEPWVD